MIALTYYSQATRAFNQEELYQLAYEASSKNRLLSVTGFLHYKKDHFLQYLEGEEETLLSLMDTITEDERHTVIRVLQLPEVNRRKFEDWYMRYWTASDFNQIELTDLVEGVLLDMNEHVFGEGVMRHRVMRLITRMAKIHKTSPFRDNQVK